MRPRLGPSAAETAGRQGPNAGRNAAFLVSVPEGRPGRGVAVTDPGPGQRGLTAANGSQLHAYVLLSLLAGLRTEELRSLQWADVDLKTHTLAVYHSVRASGDAKTPKRRRVLKLPIQQDLTSAVHEAEGRFDAASAP